MYNTDSQKTEAKDWRRLRAPNWWNLQKIMHSFQFPIWIPKWPTPLLPLFCVSSQREGGRKMNTTKKRKKERRRRRRIWWWSLHTFTERKKKSDNNKKRLPTHRIDLKPPLIQTDELRRQNLIHYSLLGAHHHHHHHHLCVQSQEKTG